MTTQSNLDNEPAETESAGSVVLFLQYHGALRRFFERRLRDRHDAEDMVQESFVRMLAHDGGDALTHRRPFLYRVASNLAIDTARRRRRSPVEASATDQPAEFADEVSPERVLAGRQELALVLAALDQLPAACRTAFLLQRVEGRNHAEIAEALGISRSMVEKHIARALLHLRETLLRIS